MRHLTMALPLPRLDKHIAAFKGKKFRSNARGFVIDNLDRVPSSMATNVEHLKVMHHIIHNSCVK